MSSQSHLNVNYCNTHYILKRNITKIGIDEIFLKKDIHNEVGIKKINIYFYQNSNLILEKEIFRFIPHKNYSLTWTCNNINNKIIVPPNANNYLFKLILEKNRKSQSGFLLAETYLPMFTLKYTIDLTKPNEYYDIDSYPLVEEPDFKIDKLDLLDNNIKIKLGKFSELLSFDRHNLNKKIIINKKYKNDYVKYFFVFLCVTIIFYWLI